MSGNGEFIPARKNQHQNFPGFCGLTVALFLSCYFLAAGWVYGAGSPFELEIGELDRGAAASKETKKTQSRLPVKRRGSKSPAVPREMSDGRQKGDFVRYTIRPGDHVFKILMIHFGLSSKKAEELIPEIKKINGIVDTSGLQIGQTILIPLVRKKVVAPRETAPVAVPASKAVAESPAPEIPPALFPAVDEGMLRRAREFWVRLFPGRKQGEPAPGAEAAGLARYPLLAGVDGREIRIVPPGKSPVFENLSGAVAEKRETVVADPGNEKGFVKDLLQAAGFATADGGAPLEFGSEPKLSLKADFTAAERLPGTEGRKTLLVLLDNNGCPVFPESLVSYLETKDFRLVEWCDLSDKLPASSTIQVVSVPPGKPEVMADAVLAAMSLKASKDYPIEIVVGQTGAAPLKVTVDRYFEGGGKRFFLDFGNAAPNRVTLFRLLELAGYQRIEVGGMDDFRTVAAKISNALNVSAEYRKYVLTSLPDGRFALEMAGILFPRPGTAGEIIFLTDIPLEQPFFDLLKAFPWGTQ